MKAVVQSIAFSSLHDASFSSRTRHGTVRLPEPPVAGVSRVKNETIECTIAESRSSIDEEVLFQQYG